MGNKVIIVIWDNGEQYDDWGTQVVGVASTLPKAVEMGEAYLAQFPGWRNHAYVRYEAHEVGKGLLFSFSDPADYPALSAGCRTPSPLA